MLETLILARDVAVAAVGEEEVLSLHQSLQDLESKHESGELSHIDKRDCFSEALRDLNDHLMPTRAHGLISLKRLIESGDQTVHQNWKRVLQLVQASLTDPESYIFLQAVNTLSALSLTRTDQVLPLLLQEYQNKDRTIQERLNVGEVIVRTSRTCPESLAKHAPNYMKTFMKTLEDEDETIRVSSISNLGHFCSGLAAAMEPFLCDLIQSIVPLITEDHSPQVRRASLMFVHMTLSTLDGHTFDVSLCQSRPVSVVHTVSVILTGDQRLWKSSEFFGSEDLQQ